MDFISRLFLRLRAIVSRSRLEREMQEELRAHIDQATERLMQRGMPEADARLAARREFGNTTVIEDQAREARGARWVEAFAGDIRFALRYFARQPLTTVAIVLVLALGIGVNSALFSVVQSFTTRPAPAVPKDDALVFVRGKEQPARGARWNPRLLSYVEFEGLAQRRELFTAVAGWTDDDVILQREGESEPRAVRVQFVTPGFFRTLGVTPVRGTGFGADGGAAGALDVVISHALWDRGFERAADIVGQIVRINGQRVRVVGVAPERFQGAVPGPRLSFVWMPLSARAAIVGSSERFLSSPDSLTFSVFARLAPRVEAEQATAVADGIAKRVATLRAEAGESHAGIDVMPLRGAMVTTPDDPMVILTLLGLVPLLILLVACTNVSSLLVAAAVGRRHELAVRLSLGASRTRLMRQLLTESALLSVTGGLAGLMLFWWITRLLAASITDVDIAPDFTTLGFTMLFALGTGLLFGLSPALHATRSGLATAIRESGGGATQRSRLQRGFVIAQIVFTQPLLVMLAIMLFAVVGEGVMFPTDAVASRIISARFRVSGTGAALAAQEADIRSLSERLSEQPGVAAVVPEAQMFALRNLAVIPSDRGSGPRAQEAVRVHIEGAAPGYFAMLEIPIVRGRDLQLSDTTGFNIPVVIGSDLARDFWGPADPIGKRLAPLKGSGEQPGLTLGELPEGDLVVVGVFDATRATTRGSGIRIYTPYGGQWRKDALLIRTNGHAQSLVPGLRKLVRTEAPELPLISFESLVDVGRLHRREALQVASGMAAAGAVALLLASIGLYAVVSLAVAQRKREIGIRIAVGGKPLRVAAMFFTSGLRLSAIGLLIGLPISLLGLRFLRAQLVAPLTVDMRLVGAGIAGIVLLVAAAATWLPAHRAATVDPSIALRVE